MGFGFHRKKSPVKREPDRIWKTQGFLFDGVLAEIEAVGDPSESSLLIAHFPSTYRSLVDYLTRKTVIHKTYPTAIEGSSLGELIEYRPGGQVLVCLANSLPRHARGMEDLGLDRQFTIGLMVVEHHPLPAADEQIAAFSAGLPCSTRLCFNDSLDSALLSHFGGDHVARIMTALNIADSQPISHPMINKTIRQTQERIARQVHNPISADSPEQWFEINLPGSK